MKKTGFLGLICLLCVLPVGAQESKRVVEEIVARVNNEIITLSDLTRARNSIAQEVDDDCRRGCTAAERQKLLADREKDLLRDLIDQSLMVQRAKDQGLSVETDLVKQLDQIRIQNNLADMEALEKAVSASGLSYEDWKNSLRNRLLTQELIRREVRPFIEDEEVKKFYAEHQSEFHRPERVYLSEIFVSTEGKKEEESPALEEKAKNLLKRIREGGEDFAGLAKRFSDGSTAKEGGELGGEGFARDQLSKEISDAVFQLNRGEVTDVIRTKTGFLILRVEQRYEAGLQPLEKVDNEIRGKLYYERLRPAMREYLKKLRGESYVMVKPGHTDSAGVDSIAISEIQPEANKEEPKKKRKKFLGII